MKMIKYPYSRLDKHHVYYLKLVEKFFMSMYNVSFHVGYDETKIIIKIYDVNPYKLYSPSEFYLSYQVRTLDNDVTTICKEDIFFCFYNYLSDIVPYLEIELIVSTDILTFYKVELDGDNCFEKFDLKTMYFEHESRLLMENKSNYFFIS
jgi:hypothetical protein